MHVPARLMLAAATVLALAQPAAGQVATAATDVGAGSAAQMAAAAGSEPAPATAAVQGPSADPGAREDAQPQPVPPAAADARIAAGPSLSAATVGVRANAAREDLTEDQLAQRAAHHAGLGTSGALMIIGAVAFIAGLIIGGGAGTAVAIAGAAVGLYGLYLYLQ